MTLFAIKINSLSAILAPTPRQTASLYVDDFQLGYRHSDLSIIQKHLQDTLHRLETWANKNGFRFSSSKTKIVHFSTLPGIYPHPRLTLYGSPLQYTSTFKFLGLTWDPKLTWKPHIATLCHSCQKPLNLLKSLTSLRWGADQRTLLLLYHLLIRSKLDYGALIYSAAAPSTLQPLLSLQNAALRFISGAFRSTPITSLHALVHEQPMHLRHQMLCLRYYFKIRSHLDNPAFHSVTDTSNTRLFHNKHLTPPFAVRVFSVLRQMQFPPLAIKPAFSYKLLGLTQPTYTLPLPSIDLTLTAHKKDATPDTVYRQEFHNVCSTSYGTYNFIYTDGSVSESGTASAALHSEGRYCATLPRAATILTAELHAISLALRLAEESSSARHLILTDSLSALNLLSHNTTDHPIVRRLQHTIFTLSRNKSINFMWIPGHCGIPGNELADQLAKFSTTRPPEYIPIYFRDYFPLLFCKLRGVWQAQWDQTNTKLHQILPFLRPFPLLRLTRQQEVILNRLRAGHSRLTHKYLMDPSLGNNAEPCPFCNDAALSVKHLFTECAELRPQQTLYLHPFSLQEVLTNRPDFAFSYLAELGLYSEI